MKAIEQTPDSHRATLRQGILVAGRVDGIRDFLDNFQSEASCAFLIPPDSTMTIWKGLSVIGDLPKELRENPNVKVRRMMVALWSHPA
jgi:hypothetical protein